jgi:hypothetical protein
VGIELNPRYAALARQVVAAEVAAHNPRLAQKYQPQIIEGDAAEAAHLGLPPVDFVLTSPPYWDMLRMKGSNTQRRRRTAGLDVFYSDDPRDLGNVADYEAFLDRLCRVYEALHPLLRDRAYLTIIVKNVKKGGTVYPLAWDIGRRLAQTYTLKDEKIWAQNDQRLAPYGLGSAWVSNTFHHYCLNFRKE